MRPAKLGEFAKGEYQVTSQMSADKPSRDPMEKIVRMVSGMIEAIRQDETTRAQGAAHDDFDRIISDDHGALVLSGKHAAAYQACLVKIQELHPLNDEQRQLSRKETERILMRAVLATIFPKLGETTRTAQFAERLDDELANLKKALTRQPEVWDVFTLVGGIDPRILPLAVGAVSIAPLTAESIESIVKQWRSEVPLNEGSPEGWASLQDELGRHFNKVLVGETTGLATTKVEALDHSAAKDRGLEQIRAVVDVLNFFSLFESSPLSARVFVVPEGGAVRIATATRHSEQAAVNLGNEHSRFPLRVAPETSSQARKAGFARITAALAKSVPSTLEVRLITAARWAGRAVASERRAETFLLLWVALEALLGRRQGRGGVTQRLQYRAAHVIGTTLEARRNVLTHMRILSDVRNEIVHAGRLEAVTDDDVSLLRQLTARAITAVLSDPRFSEIADDESFEAWLEEQLIT